jgi:hypothetical protein
MVLLIVAIASSSVGLPFVAVAGAMLLLDPERRRQIVWLVPVAVVFLVWFVLIGQSGVAGHSANVAPEALGRLPAFVAFGVADSIDAAFGLAAPLGALLGLLTIGWALRHVRDRDEIVLAVGAGLGVILLFVLIGLGRGQFGIEQANRSRYIYFGVGWVLLAICGVFGRLADDAVRSLAGGRQLTRRGALVGVLVVALAANGVVANAARLPDSAAYYAGAGGELRAYVALADRYGSALPYRPPPGTRIFIPPPAIIREYISEYGDPEHDALAPAVARPPSAIERDRALWDLIGGWVAPEQVAAPTPSTGSPPAVEELSQARLSASAGCLVVRSMAGSAGSVTLSVADGSSVIASVAEGGNGVVRLGRDAPPDQFDQRGVAFPPGAWLRFEVPPLGDGSVFGLQFVLPAGSTTRLCGPEASQP